MNHAWGKSFEVCENKYLEQASKMKTMTVCKKLLKDDSFSQTSRLFWLNPRVASLGRDCGDLQKISGTGISDGHHDYNICICYMINLKMTSSTGQIEFKFQYTKELSWDKIL